MAKLTFTSQAKPKEQADKTQTPINVCRDGIAATITTRYGSMDTTNILTLAHYPMTAVLVEYGEPIKF